MKLAQALLLGAATAAALACPPSALAQWAWRDAAGRMVYSDQPPPKSVPARDVLRSPGAAPSARLEPPADGAASAEASAAKRKAAAPTLAEREMASRLRAQQEAEAEKKAADEAARKAQLAENCDRLRAYLRALEGGFRVARVNAAGQQEFLDDQARAAETGRTRAQLEKDCP